MNVITGQYGNETIALVQWALNHKLDQLVVVNVETSWQAVGWDQRVLKAKQWLDGNGVESHTIRPRQSFDQSMREHHAMPDSQNTWCAQHMIGDTLLDWLDEVDPMLQAHLYVGNRKALSKAWQTESFHQPKSEYFERRDLFQPLLDYDNQKLIDLIAMTPLPYLSHQSLGCGPCIFSTSQDLLALDPEDLLKVKQLEDDLGQTFHASQQTILQTIEQAKQGSLSSIGPSCRLPYGCRL